MKGPHQTSHSPGAFLFFPTFSPSPLSLSPPGHVYNGWTLDSFPGVSVVWRRHLVILPLSRTCHFPVLFHSVRSQRIHIYLGTRGSTGLLYLCFNWAFRFPFLPPVVSANSIWPMTGLTVSFFPSFQNGKERFEDAFRGFAVASTPFMSVQSGPFLLFFPPTPLDSEGVLRSRPSALKTSFPFSVPRGGTKSLFWFGSHDLVSFWSIAFRDGSALLLFT